LLKETMLRAGFIPVSFEWWHFDAFEKEYVRKRFVIIK
jgi:D-alanyl-D-alanine dipeptidase